MQNLTLHYFHDPLCGWCYAAAPMADAVEAAGGTLVLHGGGLWTEPSRLASEKTDHIRQSDARIASLTGQPFGPAYTDGLLGGPETVFWSLPPIAAVLAAGQDGKGAGPRMLHAIQIAHYRDGRRVVDADVLADIAAESGLDRHAFVAAFDLAAAAGHVAQSRVLMRRFDLRGFPSFLIERGSERVQVLHEDFLGHPDRFVDAVAHAATSALQS